MDGFAALGHQTLRDVRVQAFRHPVLGFLGGPVLADAACTRLRHKRHDLPCDAFDPDLRFENRLDGDWVYLGPKYHHFGHIMAEMVHRILPSKHFFPDRQKYLLVTTPDDDAAAFDGLDKSYREVLDFCQIRPDQIAVINRDTVVRSLALCEQGANLGGHADPWYLEIVRRFSERRLDQLYDSRPSPARVYVSKSRIAHGGTILGEAYIESLLRREGYFVFHPEESPLSLQMEVYRKAKDLIFSEGSALHGTELLGSRMLDRTCVLIRRMEARGSFERVLQPRSRQVTMFLDTFFLGTVAVHRETRQPHAEFGVSLVDVDRLVAFLREHGLARLPDIDTNRYFEAAEADLRAYFSHHMQSAIADVDAWRIGEVRLAFEKIRQQSGSAPRHAVEATEMLAPSAEAIEQAAWAAHHAKRWKEAAHRWEIYRERFPNMADGFTVGSIALMELGRFYEADAVLLVACERFPDALEAHGNYAFVAYHRRDWREALARWNAFRARFPDSILGYSLAATVLCELGRYAEADDLVRQGFERNPQDEELLEKYAWAAQLRGDQGEARQRWQDLATRFPENQAARRHLDASN